MDTTTCSKGTKTMSAPLIATVADAANGAQDTAPKLDGSEERQLHEIQRSSSYPEMSILWVIDTGVCPPSLREQPLSDFIYPHACAGHSRLDHLLWRSLTPREFEKLASIPEEDEIEHYDFQS
mmetsp:Transcript_2029/g.5400  ORF Transcript_2029/g.5400 Transcript_2029/m.5400 type:complete len:123 (-) Transcript_2029:54-422(-)